MTDVNEIRKCEPKRQGRFQVRQPALPIIIGNETGLHAIPGAWPCYRGVFTGHSVLVSNLEDSTALFNMGCFGKPSTSKFNSGKPRIFRRRQYKLRDIWGSKVKPGDCNVVYQPESESSASDSEEDVPLLVDISPGLKRQHQGDCEDYETRCWYNNSLDWGENTPVYKKYPHKKPRLSPEQQSDDEILILSDSEANITSPSPDILVIEKENKNPNLESASSITSKDEELEILDDSAAKENNTSEVVIDITSPVKETPHQVTKITSERCVKLSFPEGSDKTENSSVNIVDLNISEENNEKTVEIIDLNTSIVNDMSENEEISSGENNQENIDLESSKDQISSDVSDENNQDSDIKIVSFVAGEVGKCSQENEGKTCEDAARELTSKIAPSTLHTDDAMSDSSELDFTLHLSQSDDETSGISEISHINVTSKDDITEIVPKTMDLQVNQVFKNDEKSEDKNIEILTLSESNESENVSEIDKKSEEMITKTLETVSIQPKNEFEIDEKSEDKNIETSKLSETKICETVSEPDKKSETKNKEIVTLSETTICKTHPVQNTSEPEQQSEDKNTETIITSETKSLENNSKPEQKSEAKNTEAITLPKTVITEPNSAKNVSQTDQKLEIKNAETASFETNETEVGSKGDKNSEVKIIETLTLPETAGPDPNLAENVSETDQNTESSIISETMNTILNQVGTSSKSNQISSKDISLKMESKMSEPLSEIKESNSDEPSNKSYLPNIESQKIENGVEMEENQESEENNSKIDKNSECKHQVNKISSSLTSSSEPNIVIEKNNLIENKPLEEKSDPDTDNKSDCIEIESSNEQSVSDDISKKSVECKTSSDIEISIVENSVNDVCEELSMDTDEVPNTKSEAHVVCENSDPGSPEVYEDLGMEIEDMPITESGDYEAVDTSIYERQVECVVISDSEGEGGEIKQLVDKWRPRFMCSTWQGCDESITLGLEETFFLTWALGCLHVTSPQSLLLQLLPPLHLENTDASTDTGDVIMLDAEVTTPDLPQGQGSSEGQSSSPQPGPSGMQNLQKVSAHGTKDEQENACVLLVPSVLWALSCRQANFASRYVVYHHFRSLGWVVTSGIKFGGDFLLYEQGPGYNHASYVVLVNRNNVPLTWHKVMTTNRIAEVTNKGVVMCNVTWPHDVETFECLADVRIGVRVISRPKLVPDTTSSNIEEVSSD